MAIAVDVVQSHLAQSLARYCRKINNWPRVCVHVPESETEFQATAEGHGPCRPQQLDMIQQQQLLETVCVAEAEKINARSAY